MQTPTSLNITRALIFQAHLPPLFWDFAIQHVTFLINCTPTPLLQNIALYEKLNGNLVIYPIYVFWMSLLL